MRVKTARPEGKEGGRRWGEERKGKGDRQVSARGGKKKRSSERFRSKPELLYEGNLEGLKRGGYHRHAYAVLKALELKLAGKKA